MTIISDDPKDQTKKEKLYPSRLACRDSADNYRMDDVWQEIHGEKAENTGSGVPSQADDAAHLHDKAPD